MSCGLPNNKIKKRKKVAFKQDFSDPTFHLKRYKKSGKIQVLVEADFFQMSELAYVLDHQEVRLDQLLLCFPFHPAEDCEGSEMKNHPSVERIKKMNEIITRVG